MTSSRQHYPLALEKWPRSEYVSVHDRGGSRICLVPIDFLRQSATAPGVFLAQIVRMCVVEDGVLKDSSGADVILSESVSPGRLTWQCLGERNKVIRWRMCARRRLTRHEGTEETVEHCSFQCGPRFKFARRPTVPGEETSTMSDSKRSTRNQVSSATICMATLLVLTCPSNRIIFGSHCCHGTVSAY